MDRLRDNGIDFHSVYGASDRCALAAQFSGDSGPLSHSHCNLYFSSNVRRDSQYVDLLAGPQPERISHLHAGRLVNYVHQCSSADDHVSESVSTEESI